MKRYLPVICLILCLNLTSIGFMAAEPFEDYLPIKAGMKLTFVKIIAHVDQKEPFWNVKVQKASFPESLTITWEKPQKDKAPWTGTRIITDLKLSRDFNPRFINKETKATTDTAPWISQQVLKELRSNQTADNFREGGNGAVNWAATALSVKEKIIFPVTINGKAEALHAFRLNKGLVIWNNLNNPLVLEYEPLAVPLFTSITGWKLIEINY